MPTLHIRGVPRHLCFLGDRHLNRELSGFFVGEVQAAAAKLRCGAAARGVWGGVWGGGEARERGASGELGKRCGWMTNKGS